ncbi:MAG: P1 family peptidase [Dehalococcoidia bacterium]
MTARSKNCGPYALPARDGLTDVVGLRVGHVTNVDAATGCTVVLCPPEGAVAACAVLGGAPGTRETDVMAPGNLVERVHAVLLTGGSAFGLDAATGVMRYLEQRNIGFQMPTARVPIVAGAVIYDLGVGSPGIRPCAADGEAAAQLARRGNRVCGSVGAGTGATVAKLAGMAASTKGGLGTASERLADGTIVGVLAVVNAVGEVVRPEDGQVIAAPRGPGGEPLDSLTILRRRGERQVPLMENTTVAVVATNAALHRDALRRVALMAHGGLARTLRPSHTPADGDTVFALSTGDRVHDTPDVMAIGALAARAMERAIIRGVLAATAVAGIPAVSDCFGRPDGANVNGRKKPVNKRSK